ncbi:MAG TPA: LPS export ABC transporter periplasmic protein LptC [bacterium]|nr:LPS export ABC transporter periplasmic protein LptC [bacterium]
MIKVPIKTILVLSALAAAVSTACAKDEFRGTLKGFTFEVPNKNGGRCALIDGNNATTLSGGQVEITDIKTKIFCEDGREVDVTSPRAVFNKNTRDVTTDAPVRVVTRDMIIDGIGLFWNPNNKLIEIKENVKVELTVEQDGKGLLQ